MRARKREHVLITRLLVLLAIITLALIAYGIIAGRRLRPRCESCHAVLPHGASICPRCGHDTLLYDLRPLKTEQPTADEVGSDGEVLPEGQAPKDGP